MQEIILISVLGISFYIIFTLIKKKRLGKLSLIEDHDFVKKFSDRYSDIDNQRVLEWRKNIAKALWIPAKKLSPNQSFEDIKKLLGDVDFSLAIDNMEEEFEGFFKKIRSENKEYMPKTIGELINDIIKWEKDMGEGLAKELGT